MKRNSALKRLAAIAALVVCLVFVSPTTPSAEAYHPRFCGYGGSGWYGPTYGVRGIGYRSYYRPAPRIYQTTGYYDYYPTGYYDTYPGYYGTGYYGGYYGRPYYYRGGGFGLYFGF